MGTGNKKNVFHINAVALIFMILVVIFLYCSQIFASDSVEELTNPKDLTVGIDNDQIAADEVSTGPNVDVSMIDFSGLNVNILSTEQLVVIKDIIDAELHSRGFIDYPELKKGDKGDQVIALQQRLYDLGYYNGIIKGNYADGTVKAMMQFEAENGLEVDGVASRADQNLLFSNSVDVTSGEFIESDNESKKTIVVVKKSEEEEDTEHEDYATYDYTEFFRYPENHLNEKVKLTGKVVQVMGNRTTGYQIRLTLSGSSNVVYIYIWFDPGYNILEDDNLTIYGRAQNTYTYESIWGNAVTVPSVIADEVVLK